MLTQKTVADECRCTGGGEGGGREFGGGHYIEG